MINFNADIRIFCHQLEDNVVLCPCPWKSALSWIHQPGRVIPMLLQVAPQNGQYHEFWSWIPSRPILPICHNQSGFKSAEFGGQCSGSNSSPPAGMFSSKYQTWTRWITAYGKYWPTLYSRWKFVTLSILRSELEKHRQSSPRLIYQIQCAPSGTECDIVFELMAKNLISSLNMHH